MDGYKGFQTFRQIGIAGFEPTTSPSQGERSTKLSHIPGCLTTVIADRQMRSPTFAGRVSHPGVPSVLYFTSRYEVGGMLQHSNGRNLQIV